MHSKIKVTLYHPVKGLNGIKGWCPITLVCKVALVDNNTTKHVSVIDMDRHGYCLNDVVVIFIYVFMYSFRQIMNV